MYLLVEPLLDVGHPLEVGHGGGAVLGRVLQAKETKSMISQIAILFFS